MLFNAADGYLPLNLQSALYLQREDNFVILSVLKILYLQLCFRVKTVYGKVRTRYYPPSAVRH